jgi:pimeloyl-ACP methyl ester carboxylesterase
MNPLYLGTNERRIFGIYEPAGPQANRARAAVLCNPWGSEYVYAHRSLRQLAIKLAACGYHTLRFDFFGTGDSGGDMSEADLAGWEADAVSAIEGIKDIAGTARVAVIGLRLGANIAAAVAARFADQIDALVMWDPIVSGEDYLHALLAASRPMSVAGDPDAVEVDGFVLTGTMMRDLKTIELRDVIAAPPSRTLALITERLASHDGLDVVVTPPGSKRLSIEFLPAPCPWVGSVTTSGAVPVRAIQRITEWLE